MIEDRVDHIAMAERAAELKNLAARLDERGRHDEALAAAGESARLYRRLAHRFPVMFGVDAERADALVAPRRGGPTGDSPTASTATDQPGPADEHAVAASPTPATARAAEPPIATGGQPARPRRRPVVSATVAAAAAAVLLGALGATAWALSRPPAPDPVSMKPPPAPAPIRPWTATARVDVAPDGVALRPAPSTAGEPVGRLLVADDVRIQCGEVGRETSTETGERSASWLRTVDGQYVAAVNVDFRGPGTVRNCADGQPPVPVPHHR
ncbi:hypothetical protein WIS52_04190 [Pseudonocardia nematodicida]|uniref:Ig-like domain-containing protein n=1 Tax=Pseudonocardia nematodicida TaxID=1206997 RepID=A0ABV1K5D7_9PSEU